MNVKQLLTILQEIVKTNPNGKIIFLKDGMSDVETLHIDEDGDIVLSLEDYIARDEYWNATGKVKIDLNNL